MSKQDHLKLYEEIREIKLKKGEDTTNIDIMIADIKAEIEYLFTIQKDNDNSR